MKDILLALGIEEINKGTSTGNDWLDSSGDRLSSFSPVDGERIATLVETDEQSYGSVVDKARLAFGQWRLWPAPKRGEVLRQIGEALREKKEYLGKLVSYEMGKSLQEGYGEVQEMIDICDFALGLSRQLYGLTMHSERPAHRMYEQWHPLGIVGIISAFNFPVAVWSWNSMLAMVCGDVCIWKASEKTPLSALACQKIVAEVFLANDVPEGVCNLISGGRWLGERMAQDHRIALVSATGSTRMGKEVAATVGARLGKVLLELGGNNAIIISQHADLDIAVPAAVFGAVGTAGQRCTTTRRLIVHQRIYAEVKERLKKAYGQLRIGNPLDEHYHVGPLIDKEAVNAYEQAIANCLAEGGKLITDSGVLEGAAFSSGCYVKPCIMEALGTYATVQKETFAPILYLLSYTEFDEAIKIQNAVPQGLSSSVMTLNLREAEAFLSAAGSDCGIANVNIGTSGAEIGGAFGGEKETGGGRESGSDAWKNYMRRQTNTINYGSSLPLAQGIKFDL
ncbi:L-piperidine-6-carboxylate dehydrogenase [Olivibacter sitiensis]|uniref:L-piperidine-6-carboxylate dehydrogenase n=1 Tax=Olivibacter sitiensis TaxID=376470 RepID=UPI000410C9BF|nr:aldehyde dehydrogenase family protein [Olivibacter sitiensis]